MSMTSTFMRSLLLVALGALLVGLLTGCGGGVKEEVAVVETTHGEIVLGFFPDDAPNHVANFKRLASEGVYDGVIFHRIIPGFVVQTGDPGTADPNTPKARWGTGGTGQEIGLEISERKHLRGSLAMARSMDPNSADSQFYICLQPQPRLDGQYTVFGEVLKGMEAVDAIAAVQTDMRDAPTEEVKIISARIVPKAEADLE